MELIKNGIFEGERPLFKSFNIHITDSEFLPGESAVKESRNVKVENCNFNN
jgi:hypothetical protein